MRYTRLRRQIESRTLIGTHGQPFGCPSSNSSSINATLAKRKRSINPDIDEYGDAKGEDDREEGMEIERWSMKVKKEWDGDESLGSVSGEDSEDDMPLAKLKGVKIGSYRQIDSLPPHSPTFTHHGLSIMGARNPATFSSHNGLPAPHIGSRVARLPAGEISGLQTWSPSYLPYGDMRHVNSQYASNSLFHEEQGYSPLGAASKDEGENMEKRSES